MAPQRHSVEIRHGLVHKRGEPRALEIEGLKTRAAAAIGENSGLFAVPRLVSLDLANGTITTEFIPKLKDLRELASQNAEGAYEIFEKAGRSLAFVHRELQLPADKLVPLPDYLMSATGDNVALHGDFCWGNVCYLPTERRIVLLDWASAPSLGAIASYGSRYFDLLWFSWSLFFWPPCRKVFHWRPESLMTALIGGYAQVETQFRWSRYVQYRVCLRPLLVKWWTGLPTSSPPWLWPLDTFLHSFGCLRWLRYPPRRIYRPDTSALASARGIDV